MALLKAIVAGTAALVFVTGSSLALSSGTGSSCPGSTVRAAPGQGSATVSGYSKDQLGNAAAIVNAGIQLGLNAPAQAIGVMTALGESGLRILDHGDAAGPDSRGLFQQRAGWGSLAQRMDPTTSAQLFFSHLLAVPGWQSLPPTLAAHAVQNNADPNYYTPFYAPAAQIVAALTGTANAGSCGTNGDPASLAAELVAAADNGNLRGFVPDHIKEIRWIAQGKTVPDCGIDTRILHILVLALQTFHRIGVSDLNRKCTGQIEGAGTASSHWINGGGQAVDIYSLGGSGITGADGLSLRLIGVLDPVLPTGARVGQAQCRAQAGTTVTLLHAAQLDDSCDHLHIDVAYTKDPLNPTGNAQTSP
ncbi:hypothetical protein [Cryobacterium algoricola]|uniref:hypothetical protein n=1 Tax=Cryobacterium algoricola TaxID=1259183 RepID=UPI00141AEBD2|nr:hypothetical protein [Cryobacterium algoricola]